MATKLMYLTLPAVNSDVMSDRQFCRHHDFKLCCFSIARLSANV